MVRCTYSIGLSATSLLFLRSEFEKSLRALNFDNRSPDSSADSLSLSLSTESDPSSSTSTPTSLRSLP